MVYNDHSRRGSTRVERIIDGTKLEADCRDKLGSGSVLTIVQQNEVQEELLIKRIC